MSKQKEKQERPETTYDQVKKWLDTPAMLEVLVKTLPRIIQPQPWIQIVLQRIRLDNKLMQAEPLSTMGAIMSGAGMGLRFDGPLGQAYLTTRKVNRKTESGKWIFSHYECQLQVGYKGFIDMVYRNPDVADVEARIVYQSDDFKFKYGSGAFMDHTYDHRMTEEQRGEAASLYVGVHFKSGYYSFDVYPIYDVMEIRRRALANQGITIDMSDGNMRYLKTSWEGEQYIMTAEQMDKVPWLAFPAPMIKKTGVRWSAAYWQMSPDLAQAAALVELDDAGMSQNMAGVAQNMLPSAIRTQAEANAPNASKLAPAQNASLTGVNDLAEQMAAEALGRTPQGKGEAKKGQQEPAQESSAASKQGKPKDKKPASVEPTEQEKADILAAEQLEADRFNAAQQAELGLKDNKR